MPIDPTTSAEFKSLEKKFHVDFMNRLPSRHDLEYKVWLEKRFLLRIGIALRMWEDTPKRTWIAYLLERYFWTELGMTECPSLNGAVPVFLWDDAYRPPPIDVQGLALRLQSLSLDDSCPTCTVERKIVLLAKLLHLDKIEVEMLRLAFASSSLLAPASADFPYPLNALLEEVLCHLGSKGPENYRGLYGQLLNASAEELALVVERPALVAMHLFENESWQKGRPCDATDKLLAILQGHYLTQAALIEDLHAASPDSCMVFDIDIPIEHFCEGAPAAIADVFRAAHKGTTLSRVQQEVLLHWHTGLSVDLTAIHSAAHLENYEQAIQSVIKSTINIRLRGERFCAEQLVNELSGENA